MQNFKINQLGLKKKNLNLSLKFYMKNLSELQKKIVTEKMLLFSKNLKLRLNLLKKIKFYKKGHYFYFLKIYKLKNIYSKIIFKINKMKEFKKEGVLKMRKLDKLIKNNKLKKKNVYKAIGLKFSFKI